MTSQVGIESIGVYLGAATLDVKTLAEHRGLDMRRFDNLMIKEKSVPMPFEDPVSFAVNAAKSVVDRLTQDEKNRIEMVITCSESGIDFSKSMSTYVHHYLELNRNCRLFEIKQACYCGTAGFQTAVNFVLSQTSPGGKALVITTDIARFFLGDDGDPLSEDWSYAEPTAGAGAVCMLIGEDPKIFQIDIGCNGVYGYEVMDTCRPTPDSEVGDSDLSLMAYLDCCEHAFSEYEKRVEGADYVDSFRYLGFHTPFGGMVKGAHRNMIRKLKKLDGTLIQQDFEKRVLPSLEYPQLVGNIMGGSIYLALCSMIDHADTDNPYRIGLFSYGSGCSSEFYSGVVLPEAKERLKQVAIAEQLAKRYRLSQSNYDQLLRVNRRIAFGTRNLVSDYHSFPDVFDMIEGRGLLVLKGIKEFHREYEWI